VVVNGYLHASAALLPDESPCFLAIGSCVDTTTALTWQWKGKFCFVWDSPVILQSVDSRLLTGEDNIKVYFHKLVFSNADWTILRGSHIFILHILNIEYINLTTTSMIGCLIIRVNGLIFGTGILHLIHINHQPDATVFQLIVSKFVYSSACFGRFPAHHQEFNDCSGRLWFYIRIVVIVVLCSYTIEQFNNEVY
jgi:hypothetical protein